VLILSLDGSFNFEYYSTKKSIDARPLEYAKEPPKKTTRKEEEEEKQLHNHLGLLLVSHVEDDRLAEQHDRYAEDSHDDEKLLQARLARIQLPARDIAVVVERRALQKEHVYELDEEIGRALRRVGRALEREPLDQDHQTQVDKDEEEEDGLRDELEQDAHQPPEEHVVEEREDEAEEHLHDSDDHRELHLERVGEGDLVDGERPDRVQAERVRAAAEHAQLAARHIRPRVRIEVEHVGPVELERVGHGDAPRRAEDVDRLGEDVVVDEARVDAEQGHEEDDVAAAEEDLHDLVALEAELELSLAQDHEQGEEEHDEAVARVAEHHREQERKRDDGERGRVDLAVRRDAVRVHDALEARRELVRPVMGGRLLFGLHAVQYRLDVAAA
jgi:hypothetical protein